MIEAIGLTLAISVLMTYVNHRFLHLPATVGVMLLSVVLATLLSLSEALAPAPLALFHQLIFRTELQAEFLELLLGALLFAGAIRLNINAFKPVRLHVLLSATLGVAVSAFAVGGLVYAGAWVLGIHFPLLSCLLFGALIAPTEPAAALEALLKAKAPESLRLKIEGESKFNEGMAVMLFSGLVIWVDEGGTEEGLGQLLGQIGWDLGEELLLGIGMGTAMGLGALALMRSVRDNPQLVTGLCLGLVSAAMATCSLVDAFLPAALLLAGLIVGPQLHSEAFSEATRQDNHRIWDLLDQVLTAFLFLLTGLTIHELDYRWEHVLLGLLAIPLVLAGRYVAMAILLRLQRPRPAKRGGRALLLAWGGLRGPASIALAMSHADLQGEHALLFMTCSVVVFTCIVQGLTVGALARRIFGGAA